MNLRVILTAGFNRARHVVALAEMLSRSGASICGVIVVSPFTTRRIREAVDRRGKLYLLGAARHLLNLDAKDRHSDPLDLYLSKHDVRYRSLRHWCARYGAPALSVNSLNSNVAINFLTSTKPDGVIYGGGGILKREFIASVDGRVLNAHSGRLPDIRGMNACEWSLLLDVPLAVTIHFIDTGIDTGHVVETIPLQIESGDDIARLRSKCTVIGVEGLIRNVEAIANGMRSVPGSSDSCTRQCFTLAPALKELAEQKLSASQ